MGLILQGWKSGTRLASCSAAAPDPKTKTNPNKPEKSDISERFVSTRLKFLWNFQINGAKFDFPACPHENVNNKITQSRLEWLGGV